MVQDDQAPTDEESQHVKETTSSTPETHVGGSSFTPPELTISRGKRKLPESEFVDVTQLQSRVFDLEQEFASKNLIIGNLDIRVGELEKHNSEKSSKISDLKQTMVA